MRDRTRLSERQQNILRFMENFIEQNGFPPTIRQIGEATGIGSTSVVNYNLNKLVAAGYLGRTARASRGLRLVKPTRGRAAQPVSTGGPLARVPLVGTIVASAPVEIPDTVGHYIDEDSYLQIPPALLRGIDPAQVFALKVKGDSMIDAMIRDGDIVLFRKQDTAENGEMVAVWLDQRNETTLKYFYREGSRVRLQPAHPTMDPIYVDAAQCHVQGRVLSVIRPTV
jgi:repressor LexA